MNSTTPTTHSLRRRTPGSFVLVPCPKIGRSLRCQSQLERATAIVLAACPKFVNITEQPLKIWYSWRELTHGLQIQLLSQPPEKRRRNDCISYIVPDFCVWASDGSCRLIEVKPSKNLNHALVQKKLCVAKLYALSKNWTMHVVTEVELSNTPLTRTLSLIARYRVFQADDVLCRDIRSSVPTAGISVRKLISLLNSETSAVRAHLYHLLAQDELSFDPTIEPLSDDSIIFPKGKITWDPFDSVWGSSTCSTDEPIDWSANSPTTAIFPKTQSSV